MLDLKRIRENPAELKRMLASRFADWSDVDGLLQQDALRSKLIAESAQKKAYRNQLSRKVGTAKLAGASGAEITMIMNEMRALGTDIAATDVDIAELDDKINAFLLSKPNYPHASVPVGKGEKNNTEVYRWDAAQTPVREPKPYWVLGAELHILDFDSAVRFRNTQFTVYRDLGAQLERAVINFFLDTHIRAGYREVMMPYTVMSETQAELPQLPIFEEAEDQKNSEVFRVPPAEESVTSLYRNMVLEGSELPISHCAFSAGFRPEAVGSGIGTDGLLRQHQFNKVELVKLCKPEHSYEELAGMTEQTQKVLQMLNLPYRVMLPCTGDLGFSAAKTYELEVWFPSYHRYVGISACSNCEDFQARRLDIRYRENTGDEPLFCHTLSGSGVAIGRTVAAILENHQNGDGSVTVPEVLRPYMHTDSIR